jgi:hypothetical protein
MDALSAAASVTAVVQLAQAVVFALKEYYGAVRDARADIQRLYHTINSLKVVLSSIERIKNQRGNSFLNSEMIENHSGPLQLAESELDRLRLKLGAPLQPEKRWAKSVHSMIWPFKKKDVDAILSMLERHKSSLILEVGSTNL